MTLIKRINQNIRIRTPGEKSSGAFVLIIYLIILGLFVGIGSHFSDIIFKWLGLN